jgi:uncharacterized membrane protein
VVHRTLNPGMSERISQSFHRYVIALMAAVALLLAGLVLFVPAIGAIESLIIATAGFFLLRRIWSATYRKRSLSARGFHTGQRIGTHWFYEELHDGQVLSIELKLEYVGRGGYEICIPAERAWLEHMPAWARGRRGEIVERLGTVFKRSEMRMPDP